MSASTLTFTIYKQEHTSCEIRFFLILISQLTRHFLLLIYNLILLSDFKLAFRMNSKCRLTLTIWVRLFNELLILCGGDGGFYHQELETFHPLPSRLHLTQTPGSFCQHDFSLSQKGKHIKRSDISDLIHVRPNVLSLHLLLSLIPF
jgi:hypothetical protein